jgi:hypothetical protein
VIHLDTNSAELFAQVLPVLTLVLLLEARIPVDKYRSGRVALVVELFRFTAVLYGTIGTLFCLYMVATDRVPTPLDDFFITLGFLLVSVAILLLAVQLSYGRIKDAAIRAFHEFRDTWKRTTTKL